MIVGGLGLLGSASFVRKLSAAVVTPSATEGPYCPRPKMRRADNDNDLVKIEGMVKEAGGEIITLRGTLYTKSGAPRVGHKEEIWQCDVDGNYLHTRDPRSVNFDTAFKGFGHDITDQNGAFVFRTIKPTVYPGRTPHIHVKVFNASQEKLTTKFYIKNHPENANDGLFRRMSKAQAHAVSIEFQKRNGAVETEVDVFV